MSEFCTDRPAVIELRKGSVVVTVEVAPGDEERLKGELRKLDGAGPVRVSLSLTTKEC